ncbi:hyoscyamine 6-dioxygenase-like [Vitis riparia]|uniref:hyoscyamine 6-dioxygenase-like n=1 Tax=Vitis riparia TaxID=96939 RepID=UPI00155A5B13|nr:hyoscyamine 6-dioxygenase-like [Vitis riparia]
MEKLVSSWSINVQSLPENYVLPPGQRPGKLIVPPCKSLPVVDLGKATSPDRAETIQKILEASWEFGFFQVINHGVSDNLINESRSIFSEFFNMPAEDKASLYSTDIDKSCILYTSNLNYDIEEVHLWRDNLKHPCHPLEEYVQFWPEKPTKYREIVGPFSVEVRKLSLEILDLISEGLGLEQGYFGGELSKRQLLSVNHYPRCPDPSLTLGLPKHIDPGLIAVLLQGDVDGLQVYKDGQWLGVEPLPYAFVINIGHQLQVISNGKLRGAEHRVVTNPREARTTTTTFINPSPDCVIQPAEALVNASNPPLYKAFKFIDFFKNFTAATGNPETALNPYKLQV